MSRFDTKTVLLPDGRKIVIQPASEGHAAALLELFKLLFLDGEGMISEPDEGPQTEDELRAWMKTQFGAPTNLLLLAEFEGAPDLIKKDTSKCGSLKNDVCFTTCENSVYVIGLCRDDRDGSTSAISVQCCCCTDGANHRSFIGG